MLYLINHFAYLVSEGLQAIPIKSMPLGEMALR